ncbi:hypothetical protein ABDD95_12680 [Mucilaginibacter sp. PAMB04274]|uniref:hypothetical protein n=1 Tax=Mucilaginibacter sp. PAMB04274 TaxID=3138568 RepID=UPI0031F65B3F
MKHRYRFLGMPLLFFRQLLSGQLFRNIRNYTRYYSESIVLANALKAYFGANSPELVKYFTLMIFQCWSMNECKIKSEVSDKDFALFLDELNELVEAAHRYHKSAPRIFGRLNGKPVI